MPRYMLNYMLATVLGVLEKKALLINGLYW